MDRYEKMANLLSNLLTDDEFCELQDILGSQMEYNLYQAVTTLAAKRCPDRVPFNN